MGGRRMASRNCFVWSNWNEGSCRVNNWAVWWMWLMITQDKWLPLQWPQWWQSFTSCSSPTAWLSKPNTSVLWSCSVCRCWMSIWWFSEDADAIAVSDCKTIETINSSFKTPVKFKASTHQNQSSETSRKRSFEIAMSFTLLSSLCLMRIDPGVSQQVSGDLRPADELVYSAHISQ